MSETERRRDVAGARLPAEAYGELFAGIYPPLDAHEARVEADRCYFCYDAPCVQACPTDIDIPLFIREIATGNPDGSAKTILSQNILGGMCARVCPTETLCEEVCVREVAEGQPVQIGELQRYATDHLMARGEHPFSRAAPTGKSVGVVGAGPAGLAAAHRLAMLGHDVVVYEARPKPGGLNEYGIAAYKAVDDFAQEEVEFVLKIGGIEMRYDQPLGNAVTLEDLLEAHDAVFLGMGLPDVNRLGLEGEEADGCLDAVAYIETLRQSDDLSKLPVGRNVVVIGGGMTAIDIAAQVKLLGADSVTIAYRRGQDAMNASVYEQNHARKLGVTIRHWMQPEALIVEDGAVVAIDLAATTAGPEGLRKTGEMVRLPADQVFKAIGQAGDAGPLAGAGIDMAKGRIVTDETGRTSHPKIWAGGDCTASGDDLTVTAVAEGRDAAEAIHKALME
ncbi:NAD(P)-dependent oxidoreductase [Algicella marina]|uniref:NAD(P)-binding protein n=1 Tax=Algicella marina TaxID=2683284 RepID=A0A6P1SX11_9RHOB|nr:NAD(P)-dependent oxidoreductase [Algicella marina]QHQ34200.1 NAD(P)-binding protein [Algicella marina]